MTTTPLRVGVAGLGTVGAGVVGLLAANSGLIERRAGRPIVVTAVGARDRARARGIAVEALAWVDDATALPGRDDVDAVVECIGGADGPALTLARATLSAAKPLVTANKAMLAHHGVELAILAETNATALRFEAAVAGGVPVVGALRDGAAANRIARVYGILNGTSNYILSRMEAEGLGFAAVLADAQAAGFAEADPGFDIDGVDAAHKLALLATLGFGGRPDFAAVETDGIRAVEQADIVQAAALGYRIKLVALASLDDGRLFQRVHPCLVPLAHPLATVGGATNAVVIEGDAAGRLFFSGAGAGAGPTASAVVADLVALARGDRTPPFGIGVAGLAALPAADQDAHAGRFYLRLTVADRPGVLAGLTAALRDAGVSIESLIQRGHADDGAAFVAMVTHTAAQASVRAALERMAASDDVLGRPMMMHILDL